MTAPSMSKEELQELINEVLQEEEPLHRHTLNAVQITRDDLKDMVRCCVRESAWRQAAERIGDVVLLATPPPPEDMSTQGVSGSPGLIRDVSMGKSKNPPGKISEQ